jgi:hypothetical protein
VTEVLDDQYLAWLYSQVGDVKDRNRSRTYWNLLRQLHSIEFVWIVPNDDNRVGDGLELREEWISACSLAVDLDWRTRGCSFLEMLIALCRRIVFESDGHVDTWFWHLMDNLGLCEYTDRYSYNQAEVNTRIRKVIYREYDRNGRGGLFPLRYARKDQRDVELWYQMNAYLLDG